VPRSADNVGVFEPATSALSIVDISASITGTNKYAGGVLAPKGKLYFAPWSADSVGIFDPSTNVFSALNISAVIDTDTKYSGCVLVNPEP